jgi:hypothetical protein
MSEQFTSNDPGRGLSHKQWCQRNGFSERTGWRIREAGGGPVFRQVSPGRQITTLGDDDRWKASLPPVKRPEEAA